MIRGLDSALLKAGTEILANSPTNAAVSLLPTTRKARDREIEQLIQQLQAEDDSVIGLGAVRLERGFALSLSTLLPAGQDPNEVLRTLSRRVVSLAGQSTPGLVAREASSSVAVVKPAVALELGLVEDPIRRFLSPISRVMNALLSHFIDLPPPDQKLISLARNVCKDGLISHARTAPLSGCHGVQLIVVAADEKPGDMTAWTAKVVDKIRSECASLKLTVLTPVVDQGVVPIKYNYMSGYLYVFLLVLVGFGLVLYFIHQERVGVIKKWGAAESRTTPIKDATSPATTVVVAATPVSARPAATVVPETYTPGYLIPKVLFAVVGLVVMGGALRQAGPDLRLLVVGRPAEAVAVSVVVGKPGQPDLILKNQAELDAKMKAVANAKDYTWTFYNVFNFETKAGQEIAYRRPVGCKLKPSLPLLDDNGLPTTAKLLYDDQDPSHPVLPLEYSTWLAPALVATLGLIAFVFGALLAWFAKRPIVLSVDAAVNLTDE